MALDIDTVFRDNVIKGDIHSGAHDPDKAEIRALLKTLTGSSSAPAVVKLTKAALDLVTPASENYGGLVLNDPDPTKNGYYYRSSSTWVKGRGFPDTFAYITLGGTANVQTGAVSAGVNPASVLVYFATVSTENTGPMTLSISGEVARDVVNAAGNALSAGEWTGTVLFFINGDGDYQLLFDAGAVAASAANATAANDARILAEAAAAAAGEGVAPAASRSVLADLDTSIKTSSLLKEAGREGLFSWDASDLSASVTIDTEEGDFVPPTGEDGSGGAWKRIRKYGDLFKVSEFGDDLAAAVAVAAHRGGGVVEINKRGTILLGTGLYVPPTVQIVGLGSGVSTISVDAADWTSAGDFVAKAYAGLSAGWGMFFDDGNAGVMTELPSFTTVGIKETSILFGSDPGLATGDHIIIHNTDDWSFDGYRSVDQDGEHNVVVAMEGNRAHLLYEVQNTYAFASTLKAWKVASVQRRIGGFSFDLTDAPDAGTDWGGIKVFRPRDSDISDLEIFGAKYTGIELEQALATRPKQVRASTRVEAGSTYLDYALMTTSGRDVEWLYCEGSANWAGADNGGWGNAGAVPSDDVIYRHSRFTARGTSPAASMHPNSRRGGFDNCDIEGGLMQSGVDPIGTNNRINVRRGNNPMAILGSELVRGTVLIDGTQVFSNMNAGAIAGQGCVRIRAEAERNGGGADTIGGADGPIYIKWRGGNLYATAETRPFYFEEISDDAPINYEIDITVQVDSVDGEGLIRVIHNSGTAQAQYGHMSAKNFTQAQPWGTWSSGYSPVEASFRPQQMGSWSDTSPSSSNATDSIRNFVHAYPTGYPVRGQVDLVGIELGAKTFAKVRGLEVTYIRPQVATGDDSNLPASTGFRVDWVAF